MKSAYPLSARTREPKWWAPSKGDSVYWNYPDRGVLGVVIGFVPDDEERRVGQPIIKREDGEHVVVHPMFLLPFEYGGVEWQRAAAEGRIG